MKELDDYEPGVDVVYCKQCAYLEHIKFLDVYYCDRHSVAIDDININFCMFDEYLDDKN